MGNRDRYEPGTWSWVELATTDVDAAKRFYAGLFGWEAQDNEIPGTDAVYSMQKVQGRNAAAITPQPEQQREAGVPPNWFSYVTVADVDDSTKRVAELGGQVHAGPFDVMTAGRMAVVADPPGAMLGLWQANEAIGAEIVNVPGALTWNDVATTDADAAQRFYSRLFGWSFERMETPEGAPEYWVIAHDGAAAGRNGGLRQQVPEEAGAPSHVMPYFATDALEDSVASLEKLGGAATIPITEVPNGRFAGATDPQGAHFMLFEGEFDG